MVHTLSWDLHSHITTRQKPLPTCRQQYSRSSKNMFCESVVSRKIIHENGGFLLPRTTTTPSPFSLPSSHPALPLLRCLFLLQSLANVALQCNLVFPHSFLWWNLSLSPIPHNSFPSVSLSSVFRGIVLYLLMLCFYLSGLLSPPPPLHRLCASIYIIMFVVVTRLHFITFRHSYTILGKGMRLSYSASSLVYIRRLGGFQGCLQPPGETQGKWVSQESVSTSLQWDIFAVLVEDYCLSWSLCLNLIYKPMRWKFQYMSV